MIKREIETEFLKLLEEYPIVTIIGPRQAGKTTLARYLLPNYQYVNLESPQTRSLADEDPIAFFSQLQERVIIDEIQRVPKLLSYLQVIVDEKKINGQFVITGSHQLQLKEAITQSLAGRTGVLTLLPLSLNELSSHGIEFEHFSDYIYSGFMPRVYDQNQRATQAYSNYYQSYVERDVRQLINLKNVSVFEKFIKLIAGRVGQIMDFSSLANDVGVDTKTIKHWISILEASFILFKLSPYFENFGKRVIKSPKYYFCEIGLLTFLLGIEKKEQIIRDPLVGSLFENLIVCEYLKMRLNEGKLPNLYFFRDSNGNEADLIISEGRELTLMEIKSSATYQKDFFQKLEKIKGYDEKIKKIQVVYSGENIFLNENKKFVNFKDIFPKNNSPKGTA